MASFAAASTAVHAAAGDPGRRRRARSGHRRPGGRGRRRRDAGGRRLLRPARGRRGAARGGGRGGQILVTESVRLLAGDRAGDRYEPLGPLQLEGHRRSGGRLRGGLGPATGGGRRRRPVGAAVASARPRRLPPATPSSAATRTSPSLRRAWDDGRRGRGGSCSSVARPVPARRVSRRSSPTRRTRRGAWVLYGGCDDDLALPYQPWVQAADQLLDHDAEVQSGGRRHRPNWRRCAQLLDRASGWPPNRRRPTVDPDADRYRTYGAFAALLAEAGRNVAGARRPRRPALGRTADARAAAAPRPVGAPERRPRRRHVPRHGRRGHRVAVELPGRPAARRRARSGCASPGSTSTRSSASSPRPSVTSSTTTFAGLAVELADRSGGNAFYLSELWRHLASRRASAATVAAGW